MAHYLETIINSTVDEHHNIRGHAKLVGETVADLEALFTLQTERLEWDASSPEKMSEKQKELQQKLSFLEEGLVLDSDGDWHRFNGPTAHCIIVGTFGAGATVDFETRVTGTPSSPGVIIDTDLNGITASMTAFQALTIGQGDYRAEVTGGDGTTDIDLHCRW